MDDVSKDQQPAAPLRIGSVERDRAMAALDAHLEAGRLDPEEYGERVGRVSVARTRADLEPLFADLPHPHPVLDTAAPVSPTKPATVPVRSYSGSSALFGRAGESFVALSPFLALALFFAVPGVGWWIFLLIPASGALVYGSDGHRGSKGDGRGKRGRNRRDRG